MPNGTTPQQQSAQHAQVGDLHLETVYIAPGHWEWQVIRIGPGNRELANGTAETLEEAKQACMTAAGVTNGDSVIWRRIGPDVPPE
jgi:hypothetical protein